MHCFIMHVMFYLIAFLGERYLGIIVHGFQQPRAILPIWYLGYGAVGPVSGRHNPFPGQVLPPRAR